MKIWNLVTVHHPEVVRVRVFFDADAAVTAGLAISPDTDGSIVPNPPEHVWEPFGGVRTDDRYSRGFFWLGNRVACLFTEDAHPCGCPEGVVTSALADRAEQCSSCGSTWDADDKLTAFRVGALNEAFAQAHAEDEAKTVELDAAWAQAGRDEEASEEAGLPESVTVFGRVFTDPGNIKAFWSAWTDEERATYRAAQERVIPANDPDGQRCIDNGSHRASSRHTPAECPMPTQD